MSLSKHQSVRSIEKAGSILLFLFILLFSGFIRWHYLELRPVHTDEAENAYLLAKDLGGKGYRFSPVHHHGPVLNYCLKPFMLLLGKHSFQQLDIVSLRLILMLAGVLSIAVLWLARPIVGMMGVCCSALCMSISSLLIYYNNYVIHETLLGLFSLGFLGCLWGYIINPRIRNALGVGFFAGLLFTTKITSGILFISWGMSLVVLLVLQFSALKHLFGQWFHWKYLSVLLVAAVIPVWLLYSSFLQNPAGVADAFTSLFQYHTEGGHEKPFSYYLIQLILPNFRTPVYTHESLLILLAMAGGISVIIQFIRGNRDVFVLTGIFLLSSSIVQLGIYSYLAYKTPWLMYVTWLQFALLAGIGASVVWSSLRFWIRFPLLFIFGLGIALQLKSSDLLNGRLHSDVRNPLAYSPTSSSVRHLPGFISSLGDDNPLQVVGEFMWPLPWYLRENQNVEYLSELTAGRELANLLILSDESYSNLKTRLAGRYSIYPYTLRPNFPVYVCVKSVVIRP